MKPRVHKGGVQNRELKEELRNFIIKVDVKRSSAKLNKKLKSRGMLQIQGVDGGIKILENLMEMEVCWFNWRWM